MTSKRNPPPEPKPRQTRRRSALAQEKFKAEILDLARKVFQEQGYDALSIRAVTEPLGVSQMAFYAYFQGKADLVQHLWNELLEDQLDALLAVGGIHESPEALFRAHMDAYLRYWEDHPGHYRAFLIDAVSRSGQDEVPVALTPAYRRLLQLHGERVLACVRPERRAEAPRLAELAYVKAIGYVHTTIGLNRFPFADPAALRESMIDDIVAGVVGGASRQPSGGARLP